MSPPSPIQLFQGDGLAKPDWNERFGWT